MTGVEHTNAELLEVLDAAVRWTRAGQGLDRDRTIAVLTAQQVLLERLLALRPAVVDAALLAGWAWDEIAEACGTPMHVLHQEYREHLRTRDVLRCPAIIGVRPRGELVECARPLPCTEHHPNVHPIGAA